MVGIDNINPGVVRLDPQTGKELERWQFPGPVPAIAFAPDGRHVVTGNANGTVYVLRLAEPPKP